MKAAFELQSSRVFEKRSEEMYEKLALPAGYLGQASGPSIRQSFSIKTGPHKKSSHSVG